MYCKNCGNKLENNNEFCGICGKKIEITNRNAKGTRNELNKILANLSFINVIIMVPYTFGLGVGVIVTALIGPFLIAPQTILAIISLLGKNKFILDVIFILGGLISTILTLSTVNYKFNKFIILNIFWLMIMFVNSLINNKKSKTK